MPELSMVEALQAAAQEALRRDPRAVAVDQDTGKERYGGRLTDGPLRNFDPPRVFRVRLTEPGVISLGVGLAMRGLHPILEIDRCSSDAMSRILSDLACSRARGGGVYDVQLTLCVPSFCGAASPEDHADSREAVFAHTSGLKVVTPGTCQGAFDMLLAAVNDPDPVVFIQPLSSYQDRDEVDLNAPGQQLGEAKLLRDGEYATLVCWGAVVNRCLQVADAVTAAGVSVQVLDLCSLIPLDDYRLTLCAERTHRVVVVHDAPLTAGFGAEIAARLMERAGGDLQAVLRVAGMDVPHPPLAYESTYRPSCERIRETLLEVLDAPARDQLMRRGHGRSRAAGGAGANSREESQLLSAAQ